MAEPTWNDIVNEAFKGPLAEPSLVQQAFAPETPAAEPWAGARAWNRLKAGAQQAADVIYPAAPAPPVGWKEFAGRTLRGLGGGISEMALPSTFAGEVAKPYLKQFSEYSQHLTDESLDNQIQQAQETVARLSAAGLLAPNHDAVTHLENLQVTRALPYEERIKQDVAGMQSAVEFGAGFAPATAGVSRLLRAGRGAAVAPAIAAQERQLAQAAARPATRPYQEVTPELAAPAAGPELPRGWEPTALPEQPRVLRPEILGPEGRAMEPTLPVAREVAEARVPAPEASSLLDEFGKPVPMSEVVRRAFEPEVAPAPAVVAEAARPLRSAGQLAEDVTGGRITPRPEMTEQGFADLARGEALTAERAIGRELTRGSQEPPLPEGALERSLEPEMPELPKPAAEYVVPSRRGVKAKLREQGGAVYPSREAYEGAPQGMRQLRSMRQAEGPEGLPVEPEPRTLRGRKGEPGPPVPALPEIRNSQDIDRIIESRGIEGGTAPSEKSLTRIAEDLGLDQQRLADYHGKSPFTGNELNNYKALMTEHAQLVRRAAADLTAATTAGKQVARDALRDSLMRQGLIAGHMVGSPSEIARLRKAIRQMPDELVDSAAKIINDAGDDIAAVTRVARRISNPRLWDKAMYTYVNMLLSSPVTHFVNATSNALNAATIPVEKGFAGLGKLSVGKVSEAGEAFTEAGDLFIGMMQSAFGGSAWRAARESFGTRVPRAGMNRGDYIQRLHAQGARVRGQASQLERMRQQPFEKYKKTGELIGVPSRGLASGDELFRAIVANGNLYADGAKLARKQGLTGQNFKDFVQRYITSEATDESLLKAWKESEYRTFNKKLGAVGQAVLALRGKEIGKSGIAPGEFFLPFVSTPINIGKYSLERSPLGFLMAIHKANRTAEQMAKPLMGTTAILLTALATYAMDGRINGRGPADPAKRAVWAQNHRPYTLEAEVGGKKVFIPFERIEWLATVLGGTADLMQAIEDVKDRGAWDQSDVDEQAKLIGVIIARTARAVLNKTYTQTLVSITDALADPDRFWNKALSSVTSAIQPVALVSSMARAFDPYKREVGPFEQPIAEIPVASRALRPSLTPFGEPQERPGGQTAWGFIQRAFSPSQFEVIQPDRLMTMLEKSGIGIGTASRDLPDGTRMNDEQFHTYRRVSGQLFKEYLNEVVEDFAGLSTDEQKTMVRDALSRAREEARYQLVDEGVLPEGALESQMYRQEE